MNLDKLKKSLRELIDEKEGKGVSKFKTFRMSAGLGSKLAASVTQNAIISGNWRSTNALTSLEFTMATPGNFTSLTRFSIYGIKG
jgi:hypothetical protein